MFMQTKISITGFKNSKLKQLEIFLDFEDETISNFYNYNIIKNNIDKNPISKIFKEFKI